MKKKIFDIEKIGFGDETYHKPALPKEQKRSKETVLTQKVKKGETPKVVEQKAKISPVRPVVREKTPRKTGFTSEAFISPITGRKPKKVETVHVAYGKYELKSDIKSTDVPSPSFNECKFKDQFLTEEVKPLESQANDMIGEDNFVVESLDEETTREPSFLIDEEVVETQGESPKVQERVIEETKKSQEEVTETREEVAEEVTETQEEVAEEVTETQEEVAEEVTETQEEVAEEVTETQEEVAEEVTETQEEVTEEVAEIQEEIPEDVFEENNYLKTTVSIKKETANTFADILTDETLNENLEIRSSNSQDHQVMDEKNVQQLSENQLQDVRELLDNVYTKFFCEKDESNEEEVLKQMEDISIETTLTEEYFPVMEEEVEEVAEAEIGFDENNQNIFGSVGSVHDVEGVIDILNNEGTVHSLIDSLLIEDGLMVDGHYHDLFDGEESLNESESELLFEVDTLENQNDDFVESVAENVIINDEPVTYYETPSLNLLNDADYQENDIEQWIFEKMDILNQTFNDFGVKVRLTGDYTQGPTVIQIEIQPESGTKINKILGLQNDLKLNLSVEELRIEPISGKNTIGIEIPNPNRRLVKLKEVLSRSEFILHESPLCIGLGEDIAGNPVYADILKMPHGLIAGQTGSGKSVCINTLLISILYKASPEEVRLMLIDPKRVELAPYNEIPHLITPVITDEKKAANGLKWAVEEMERRYELFAQNGVRDIKTFNNRRHDFELDYVKMPYIVIVIDELADLMMVSAQEVEDYVMRITQKARAAGIHMIVATQRPTVDVITGTVKSNIPSRIAFTVAQANDSRVILDENGAQNLLGYGDLLWSQSGTKLKRVQCSYITDEEIERIVEMIKSQGKPKYLIEDQFFEKGKMDLLLESDPLVRQAMEFFLSRGHVTTSSLQTRMSIGYNRAARIIDILEQQGLISEPQGPNRKREIKVTHEELALLFDVTRG